MRDMGNDDAFNHFALGNNRKKNVLSRSCIGIEGNRTCISHTEDSLSLTHLWHERSN